jgi:hypothetical protein
MSLIEISISTALVSVIFLAVFLVVDKGMRFYRLNNDANDTQRGVLAFLSRLNTVMQNTSPSLIFIDSATVPGPTGDWDYGESRGLAYATPFDANGAASYSVAKALYWQGYGCFYLDSQNSMRYILKYNGQLTSPHGEDTSPPAPNLTLPPMTPAHFGTTTEGILLAKNVTSLTFKRKDASGLTQRQRYYEVSVECGKKGDPLGFWMQMSSSFYPRN